MAPTSEKSTPKADQRFVCDECGYGSDMKDRLIDHVNGVHLKLNVSKQRAEDFARWHSRCELACLECGEVYLKVKLFKTHLLSEHHMKAGRGSFLRC